MNSKKLIYLDNAATSFPKAPEVLAEVQKAIKDYGGNPGRGSHPLALKAAETIYECRSLAAEQFGAGAPENVVFTLNTTYALNLLIKGLLRPHDHILISDLEHNAVYRPLYRLASEHLIEYDIFPTYPERGCPPTDICHGIAERLKPNTKLLLCTHSSNICSAILPIAEIGAFCHRRNLLFAIDAAQSAGHLDIDMERMNIDFLCAPGHKALGGIQGVGLMAMKNPMQLDTLVEGGNGLWSLEGAMSEEVPERFEAGTLPTPAIASLGVALRRLKQKESAEIRAHECMLHGHLCDRLSSLRDIRIFLPELEGSVLLFEKCGEASEMTAKKLSDHGICVRAGHHCAALAHKTLGTPEGGAVRVSFGPYNTVHDLDALYKALKKE